MPKNKGKGGKNNRKNKNTTTVKHDVVTKMDGQEYGQVTKLLGGSHVECDCFDGQKRQCLIRGKMRKRSWVNQGDIVLIGLRDYQDGKADVMLKYTYDDVRQLHRLGALPKHVTTNDDDRQQPDGFEFMSVSSSQDEHDFDITPQPAQR